MDEQQKVEELPLRKYFPPTLSLVAYVYGMILLTAIIAGATGYILGQKTSTPLQTTTKSATENTMVSPTPNVDTDNDGDIDYFKVTGTISTDTAYYDKLYVYVDEIKDAQETHKQADFRMVYKVQPGVAYPFDFGRLYPTLTYIFTASACHSDDKDNCIVVTQKVHTSNCSGTMKGTNCIIKSVDSGEGTVDFTVKQADNPSITPTRSK